MKLKPEQWWTELGLDVWGGIAYIKDPKKSTQKVADFFEIKMWCL